VATTVELHENSNILVLMDLSNLNFDGGSEIHEGFCDGNFNSNLLCTT